jgi:hypothetical protein
MVTRKHCEDCGCPADICDAVSAAAIPWLSIILLMAKYGPSIVAIIQRDIAAGKTLQEIIRDLLDLVTPTMKSVSP